jgi:hypothetical protein
MTASPPGRSRARQPGAAGGVAAPAAAQDTPGPAGPAPGGDDDGPGELDAGDEDFYADAFEVLP